MKKVKLYSKITNTDFDLLNSIQKLYIKRISKHHNISQLIINPLDFELLLIECKRKFDAKYCEGMSLNLFGILVVKDYSCEFGSWYFK